MNVFNYGYLQKKYRNKIENFLESLGYENVVVKFTSTRDYVNGLLVQMTIVESSRKFKYIGEFKLVEMPGCCGILISTGTNINKDFQGKGIAKFLQTIKEDMARDAEYTQLYCTAVETNKAQIHILESYDWKKVSTFVNQRTGNTVSLFIKDITNPVVELNSEKEK